MIHLRQEGRPDAPLHINAFNKFPREERRANVLSALGRGLPDIRAYEGGFAGSTAAVVGAGPSVEGSIEELRRWPGPILACEKIAPLLAAAGIHVHFVVALDASDDVARSIAAGPADAVYLLALQCAPSAFDALRARAAAVFLNIMDDVEVDEFLELADITVVNSGASVTIGCAALAMLLGCRTIHVFGFDCHLRAGSYAAGATGVGVDPVIVPVEIKGRTWKTTWAYLEFAKQMLQLRHLGRELGHLDDLRIHGDSLACALSREDVAAA